MKTNINSFENLPEWLLKKWQEIADLLADTFDFPVALIMKNEGDILEVFIKNNSPKNPFVLGDRTAWYGTYWQETIQSQKKLKVTNATKVKKWIQTPDLEKGMVAYLGYPLNFPDKQPFGTICLLNNVETNFNEKTDKLLKQFKDVIELDLALVQSFELKSIEDAKKIKEQHTQLLQANLDMKIAKEKAEESNHLKTAFLQNISHEIRTPMNAIVGFSDFICQQDIKQEERKHYCEIIKNSTFQLLSIVDNVLTISSLEANQEQITLKEVNINSVFNEMLSIFRLQAIGQNITLFIKKQFKDNEAKILTDKTKLNQILTNLLNNSFKFTNEGNIETGYKVQGNNLLFYVKDTGIGIAPDMHEVIFERFRQAHHGINTFYSGTGLGLSISKSFVELLGGEIWLESEVGVGTTFYFTIPYLPVENGLIEELEKKQEEKAKILIVEDEAYNYLFLKNSLRKMNYNLIHAKNGQEAVNLCKEDLSIKIVLMDIRMPVLEGHIAAQQIKQDRPNLPIIAQTAYALESEIEKYHGEWFDEYMKKPINKDELVQKIKKHLK